MSPSSTPRRGSGGPGTKKAETVRAVLEDDRRVAGLASAFSTIFFLDSGAASKLVAYAEEEGEARAGYETLVGGRRATARRRRVVHIMV